VPPEKVDALFVFLGEKLRQPIRRQKCVLGPKERVPHDDAVAFAAEMVPHDKDRVESVRVQGHQLGVVALVNKDFRARSRASELVTNG
jgi:hypothetical protein